LKEGVYFWEFRILSNHYPDQGYTLPGGNVRVGITRIEGNLERNIGADGYSYGVGDHDARIIHAALTHALTPGEDWVPGDVFGFQITLPPLEVHKKVVDGTYDPAVDGPETWSNRPKPTTVSYVNIVRDRNPFLTKSKQIFFEQQNYDHQELEWDNPAIKKGFAEMQARLFPPKESAVINFNPSLIPKQKGDDAIPPNQNHPDPRYRTLPGSKLELWKNGKYLGIIFDNLLAFLVPASKIHPGGVDRPAGREYADDGTLGYYPAAGSCYGGAVEAKFVEPFWFGPVPPAVEEEPAAKKAKKDKGRSVATQAASPAGFKPPPYVPAEPQSLMDRYNEQIAEDVVYDLLDELTAFFDDEMAALGAAAAPVVETAAAAAEEE
jgi:COMPASS component BRE2